MPKKTAAQLAQRAKWNREWIQKNRTRYNQAKGEYRFRLKIEALRYYSNGSLACSQCGFDSDLDALCLDHINDDGMAQRNLHRMGGRRSNGNISGYRVYEVLKAKGWLTGLQVLCFNCNAIKEVRRRRGRTAADMLIALTNPQGWKVR